MLNKKHIILSTLLLLVAFFNAKAQGLPENPNVVVILTDDQGYADFGFHDDTEFPASADVLTPNLDALATGGIYFRNGYAANATCGPSRASLLTGRSCSRFGMEGNDNWANGDTGPLDTEIFLPKLLENTAYVSGAIGKWHLGTASNDLRPIGRGFNYYWGNDEYTTEPEGTALGYYKDYRMQRAGLELPPCWVSQGGAPAEFDIPDYGKYLTDAVTDEARSFIKRNKNNPFFAYVAYHAPHSPFQVKEATIQRIVAHKPSLQTVYDRLLTYTDMWSGTGGERLFDHKEYRKNEIEAAGKTVAEVEDNLTEELRLLYLAMLLKVDDGVGDIMQTLEDENLLDNTLIIYLSDNGGALERPVDFGCVNLPLRDGKGSIYDGGNRVPFVMNWKNVLPAGQESDLMVSAMDIFTTTAELAGVDLPSDRVIDGVNLIPYLIGDKQGEVAHEYLFFRRTNDNIYAIRTGDEKLVRNINEQSGKNRVHTIGGDLYDIQNDITELNPITDTSRKDELQTLYDTYVKDLPPPVTFDESSSSELYIGLTLSAEDPNNQKTINLYPNPVASIFNITFSTANQFKGDIELHTIEGRSVYKKSQVFTGSNIVPFDITNLSSAVYILIVKGENGQIVYKQKLIKK
ncbi:sulfatase-like hydrolase/transferase [uncultured Algibacter sp.]|uniref:sulfatase-like hydrolase/transferase n=1 Tax=uncultured Algibacter sp. TaxID=298659 RepID=UPI002636085B|nr:sulfatase-like hydrolase/transferase [uncultured Algibacter sp.]